jgi:hypothetical protein
MSTLMALALAATLQGEVVHSGTVRVALPPDEALELFTPEGETRWAPGWRPVYVSPSDGSPVIGGVWLTQDHVTPPDDATVEDGIWQAEESANQTIWRVQNFDRVAREAEYLRITPGNRVVTVHVRLAAHGDSTLATVTYRALAISDAGRAWLVTFTPERYAAMLREWERFIAEHLAARRT